MTKKALLADMILPLDPQDQILQNGYILLEDDKIIALGEQKDLKAEPGLEKIDLGARLLMPGLVNAHAHTPMVLFRGQAEGISLFTMEGFINCLRRLESAMDESMVAAAVEVSCAEMIRTGTTTFVDQYFYMKEIVPVVKKSGMRAVLGYGIVELGDPENRSREIDSATKFLEDLEANPLVTGWVGPHAFFVDNSEEVIKLELDLAKKFDAGLHIHMATNWEEEEYCQEKYGTSAVVQMEKLGILEFPLIAAHCITIPEKDFPTLAKNPFTAAICPSASMRSGFPAAPLLAMRQAGVNTALGTDNVANANSYDLFTEMHVAAKLMTNREKTPGAIPARDILDMATMGGARAIGMQDKIGSLEPGKQADIIALDLNEIGWGPLGAQDIYTALVYSISGMHVTDVMVDGNWLYRNNNWKTVDHQKANQTMNADFAKLKKRLPPLEQ
ncbi:MAG: amidohydrolase [Anaerolineaceae bacterium]|nr:amidohydrolase [Anaerolineaceae bacterium]